MYNVTLINNGISITIHSADGLNAIGSGQIIDAANEISSFTFTVYPNNIGYELIKPMITHVDVYNTDRAHSDFYGRVISVTPGMNVEGLVYKTVICESRAGYLCDSVQPYTAERQYSGDDTRNGLQEFIDVVLANHNAQVEDYKKIYRGEVTIITYESSGGVYKGLNYETTFDTLKTKLLDVFGGEMRLRVSDGVTYLDYKPRLGNTRATKIEVAQNMQSADKNVDLSTTISRLIPLGAKLTKTEIDANGNETETTTEERLTIAAVNDGKNYIENETALTLYGVQYGTVEYDDIHDAQTLMNTATEYFIQQSPQASYNVSALDLSLLGVSPDDFTLYDSYPVVNSYIGLNDTLEIIRIERDILSPHTPVITFGSKAALLSDQLVNTDTSIGDLQREISKNATESKNDINGIYTFVTTTATALQQNTDSLIASVTASTVSKSDYEEFSETVKNILKMDANGTTMIFQTIQEAIEAVDNAQQTNYREILKYIRFEDGNIILGEKDNPITLTLENDILAFRQNGVMVAYLSNNRFQVTDGTFLNSLRIGKFAFVPRVNGNLSFKKVGDSN